MLVVTCCCNLNLTRTNHDKGNSSMRTFLIILVLVILAALGYLGYAHFSGGAVPTFGLPIGGERGEIRARTLTFFEDVKFKNTNAFKDFVANNVSPEQVLSYLEQSLGLNQERDLNHVLIKQVELDSAAQRGRVRVSLSGQDLKTKKPFNEEKTDFSL